MRLVRIRRRRWLRKLLLLWLRKLDVVRRWWTRSSYKFVKKSVTLRQFKFYASKLICSSLSCIFFFFFNFFFFLYGLASHKRRRSVQKSLSCIFRRGLQGIDALASCCCSTCCCRLQCIDALFSCCGSTCCCCLQYIDALFQLDNFGLSIRKLLRTAVKITGETWKPLAFSTSDALCDELL